MPRLRFTDDPASRLVIAVGSVICVIFLTSQILEWEFLRGVSPDTLRALHLIRGIVSSIIVAIVTAWVIVRTPPLLFTDSHGSKDLLLPGGDEERTNYYARWFLQMRWVAILTAFTLTFISIHALRVLPSFLWLPLVVTLLGLVALNLACAAHLRRNKATSTFLLIQAVLDLIFLTSLLHFSGGIENPLALLSLIHVVMGGILLNRRQCYAVAAVAGLSFALLAWAEWSHTWEHYTLLIFPHGEGEHMHSSHQTLFVISRIALQWVLLFLTAYFVSVLAEQSRLHKQRWEKAAEKALADRQLLERALETTQTGLRVVDRQMNPIWMNHWWMNWFANCEKVETEALCEVEKLTFSDGMVRNIEIRRNGNPSDSYYQVTTAPLPDRDGQTDEIAHLAQDITAQKEQDREMMKADKLAAVGKLAGNVAHEVNNPIAIITAKGRLLLSDRREEMSDQVATEISKIVSLADRVGHIAQGLLSYCRTAASIHSLIDLRLPVTKAVSLLEEKARMSNVTILQELPDRLPVLANPNEMEQVFLNLFLNAFDAMPNGGTLRITGRRPDSAVVMIHDSGSGIPAEIQEKIFEPFFSTKEEGRGTGLGLSICQGLVHSHGGEIEIKSSIDHGTSVIVKLPLVQTEGENARA